MNETNPKQQVIVFWIMWLALLSAIIAYQFALGGGILEGKDSEEPVNIVFPSLAFGHILISTCIRWLFIPKAKSIQTLLILFIIGATLPEAAELIGIFIISSDYPKTKMIIFILSVLSTLQFMPTYLNKALEPSRWSMRDNRFA